MKKELNLNLLFFNKDNHSNEENLQVNEKNLLGGSLVVSCSISQ